MIVKLDGIMAANGRFYAETDMEPYFSCLDVVFFKDKCMNIKPDKRNGRKYNPKKHKVLYDTRDTKSMELAGIVFILINKLMGGPV